MSDDVADAGRRWHARLLTCLVSAAALLGSASAQEATITPNYKDADIRQIVEAVSEVTDKNFIIDPRVNAKVTMLSATPMTPEAFYEAFLAILQVHGFVAVPSGNLVKIMPDANARQVPGDDLPVTISATSDALVTQVIGLRNVGAAQLVPILRPLIPQYGHLAAHPGSNMLIISDRANNVARMIRIIQRIDQSGDEDIEVIRLEHATAADLVRVVNALYQSAGRAETGVTTVNLVSDDRTNSVLISGERNARLRLRVLIAHLDTPLESGGDTQVRYLHYADAETLATALREQVTQQQQQQQQQGAAAPTTQGEVIIWADTHTNALVITAPPKTMRSLMQVIDKIDIRRYQVSVEALIVEITADKAKELGITWAVDGATSGDNVVGFTRFSDFGVVDAIQGVISSGGVPEGFTAPQGITLAVGRFEDSGTNFAVLLRALAGDANTNIISTPSIVTMDNEEAEIKVAQEVPFLTGQFTQTGAAQGAVNPFQTIQRQEVGTILKITPQINEGDAVKLKISQEISSLAESSAGAVDLITNKRTITTNVLVQDGGVVVLGGLIEDNLRESEQRVPILGSIPLLGELFKSRRTAKVKTNLMVFIRPKILRDGAAAAIETNAKYNYMRDQQLRRDPDDVSLMPGERRPVLPPIEELRSSPPALPIPNEPAAEESEQP